MKEREIETRAMAALYTLSQPKHWNYQRFNDVFMLAGALRQSIPAVNRPDSIHLQGLRPFIDDLLQRTTKSGREHARTMFIDSGKGLVMSHRITRGGTHSVHLDFTPKPGRESMQKPIGSFHVHPLTGDSPNGFSEQDFQTFLTDPQQQVMLIGYGESNLLMTLKTSATPKSYPEAIRRRISACQKDFLDRRGTHILQQIVDFNKALCTEFGLTLYAANKGSRISSAGLR